MAFDIEHWKTQVYIGYQKVQRAFWRESTNQLYATLSVLAIWPVVEAAQRGDWGAVGALASLTAANLGTNLLANQIQNWKDQGSTIQQVNQDLAQDPAFRAELDLILQKLDAIPAAEQALPPADRAWFVETLQRELAQLKSGISYQATVHGGGVVVQGSNSFAVGENGIGVNGNVQGDILAPGAVKIVNPDPLVTAEEKARRAYLIKLRRHCQAMALAALGGDDDTDDTLTLDDVYIDLDTTINIKTKDLAALRAGKIQTLPQPIEQNPNDFDENIREVLGRDKKEIAPLPILDAIRISPRAVLLGVPGSGKSTFVRKLLGMQAAILLGERQPFVGIDSDLLPVLVVLRDLEPVLRGLQLEHLSADEQKEQLLEAFQQMQSTAFVRKALESGRVLLVLDGLDEVLPDLRRLVRQTVAALLSTYHIERLIITSRIRSYTGAVVFERIPVFTLRPFDEQKISNFARAWYGTQTRLGRVREQERDDKIKDLAKAATSDLRELASNPMLLTSMAIIHQKEIGLPRERVRLYKLVVDVLLRRWQKHKLGESRMAPSEKLLAFLKDEGRLLTAMERLAYEAHRAGKGKKNVADLPRSDALVLLEKEYLGEIGLAHEFLDYVDQRSGLMKGNGGELDKPTSYSFPHRTFQEYLAGCYLIRDRSAAREYYRHAAEGDFWALAAQLGAEELYHNRRGPAYMRDLAYELLPGEAPRSQTDQRAALWSGVVAQIAGKQEIEADVDSPKGGTKYLHSARQALLAVLRGDLPPIERAEAGRVLAKLGDPRPEVLDSQQMALCHIPAGEFLFGVEKTKTSLPEYWMGKYPVTNAQFGQFVAVDGYHNAAYWQKAKTDGYWTDAGFKGRFDDVPRTAPVDYSEPYTLPNHPIVGVSWYEALAYCAWLGEQLQRPVTLPDEAHWEKAARGTDGRMYPWGEKFDANKANTAETGSGIPSAVGCFPAGESPYGLLDASGNVWEWVDGEKNLRGGSFLYYLVNARCAFRDWYFPAYGFTNYGFRIMVSM